MDLRPKECGDMSYVNLKVGISLLSPQTRHEKFQSLGKHIYTYFRINRVS